MKKKIAFLAAAVFTIMLSISSCKIAEDCPAYGQVDINTEETVNS